MTIYCVVAVFDTAAQGYAMPFMVPSRAVAIRSFRDEVNRDDKDNGLFKHPSDYELRCLGTWDSDSGVYRCESTETLARAKDLVEVDQS